MSATAFGEWTSVHTEGDIQVDYVGGATIGAAREFAAPGRVGPRHRHDHTEELMLVGEGELSMTIGEETRTLRAGDVAIVAPGTEHELYTEDGCTYYLVFSPGLPKDDFILCPRD